MIALSSKCLLFQLSNGESVPCSAEMICVEVVGSANCLLDAEMPLEYLVSGNGGRFDAVLGPRPPYLETKEDELKKCERSHDIDISHGCSSPVIGF